MFLNPVKCSLMLNKKGDKAFYFFVTLNKKEKFKWTSECGEAFLNLKEFMASSPILKRLITSFPLYLYMFVTNQVMSLVFVQETDRVGWPVYLVGKVFKGTETRYQKIEIFALAVVIIARKLIPYFQRHWIHSICWACFVPSYFFLDFYECGIQFILSIFL